MEEELLQPVMTLIETDEAIEYSRLGGMTQLKHEWFNGKHVYSTKFYSGQHNRLRYVLFPGVISCHVVIGYDVTSNIYWFAHVSANQVYQGSVSQSLNPCPLAYSQILAENYHMKTAIEPGAKVNFVIIDKAGFYNPTVFGRALRGRINTAKTVCPEVSYSHRNTSIFICYDIQERKIYYIENPLIGRLGYPSSVAKLNENLQECVADYRMTDFDKSVIKAIQKVVLGRLSYPLYEAAYIR